MTDRMFDTVPLFVIGVLSFGVFGLGGIISVGETSWTGVLAVLAGSLLMIVSLGMFFSAIGDIDGDYAMYGMVFAILLWFGFENNSDLTPEVYLGWMIGISILFFLLLAVGVFVFVKAEAKR